MFEFWLALLIFLASHSVASRTGLRAFLIQKWGKKKYTILYSILSTALLIWLIIAAQNAPRIHLWPWVYELYWFPNIFMPFAFILLISGFIVPNPVSLIPKSRGFDPLRPSFMIAITRHPILWGFFLWSTSHIIPNGEYPLVAMFIVFSLFSIFGLVITDLKFKRELGHDTWETLTQNTSSIIFLSPSLWGGNFHFTKHDLISICLGLSFYVLVYHFHDWLFGMNPIPPL